MDDRERYKGKSKGGVGLKKMKIENSSKFNQMRELSKKRKIKNPLNDSMNDSLNETIRGLEILWSEQKKNRSFQGNNTKMGSQRKRRDSYSSNTKIQRAGLEGKNERREDPQVIVRSELDAARLEEVARRHVKVDKSGKKKERFFRSDASYEAKTPIAKTPGQMSRDRLRNLNQTQNSKTNNSTIREKRRRKSVVDDPIITRFDKRNQERSKKNSYSREIGNSSKFSFRNQKKKNSMSLKNRILSMKNKEKSASNVRKGNYNSTKNQAYGKKRQDRSQRRPRKSQNTLNFSNSDVYHGYSQKFSQRKRSHQMYSPGENRDRENRERNLSKSRNTYKREKSKNKDKNKKKVNVLNSKLDRLKNQVKKLTDNFEVVKCDMENITFDDSVRRSNKQFDKNIKNLMKMVQDAIQHQQNVINSTLGPQQRVNPETQNSGNRGSLAPPTTFKPTKASLTTPQYQLSQAIKAKRHYFTFYKLLKIITYKTNYL